MELSTALSEFYGGNDAVFMDIWNNIKYLINWKKVFDPTGALTKEDFQMECCECLWKNIYKWDPKRGTFQTYAINVVYRYLFQRIRRYLKKFWISENKLPTIFSIDDCYNISVESKSENQLIYKYTANLIVSYFKEPILRDIFAILVFNPDKFYFSPRRKDKSTIYKISEKYNMKPKDVLQLIKKHKKEIESIILEN